MADRLTLTRAFEASGIETQAAERIATEIYDAIHENVATKGDIAALRADISALSAATKADVAGVRADLKIAIRDLKIWLGSVAVATGGILFAALHYWPPR